MSLYLDKRLLAFSGRIMDHRTAQEDACIANDICRSQTAKKRGSENGDNCIERRICLMGDERQRRYSPYSVVTDLARFRGKSTSTPFMIARSEWCELAPRSLALTHQKVNSR